VSHRINTKLYTYSRCAECTTVNYKRKFTRNPHGFCGYCGGELKRMRQPKGRERNGERLTHNSREGR